MRNYILLIAILMVSSGCVAAQAAKTDEAVAPVAVKLSGVEQAIQIKGIQRINVNLVKAEDKYTCQVAAFFDGLVLPGIPQDTCDKAIAMTFSQVNAIFGKPAEKEDKK